MTKLKDTYFLYYPNDDFEEFADEAMLLERVRWLVDFSAVDWDEMRVIIGREYSIKRTTGYSLEENQEL